MRLFSDDDQPRNSYIVPIYFPSILILRRISAPQRDFIDCRRNFNAVRNAFPGGLAIRRTEAGGSQSAGFAMTRSTWQPSREKAHARSFTCHTSPVWPDRSMSGARKAMRIGMPTSFAQNKKDIPVVLKGALHLNRCLRNASFGLRDSWRNNKEYHRTSICPERDGPRGPGGYPPPCQFH